MVSEKGAINRFKSRLHEVIFEADTKEGKVFDEVLLVSIILSVLIVILDSVPSLETSHGPFFHSAEWFFTILFTIEYLLRIWITKKSFKYMFSFFGIIDLIAIIPTYLSLLMPGGELIIIVRMLRLLRIFRILKLMQYISATNLLMDSLIKSRYKISVFILFVSILVTILGAILYLVEGAQSGFTSIPRGIYWAIITLTTVGYGDITPSTVAGQSIASVVMLLGYAIIAVPTGIITSQIIDSKRYLAKTNTQHCSRCNYHNHEDDALFCKVCGNALNRPKTNCPEEE